jgi:fluoride exporter
VTSGDRPLDDPALAEQDRPTARITVAEAALVFAGGGLGSLARYAVLPHLSASLTEIPWALLALNTAGCIALGALLPFFDARPHHGVRLFTTTGLLGGWTTYSSVALVGAELFRNHCTGRAITFLALSLTLGVGGAWLGEQAWLPRRKFS